MIVPCAVNAGGVVGSTGVEKEYTDVLSGRDRSRLRLRDLGDLLLGKEQTGNVVLTGPAGDLIKNEMVRKAYLGED